MSEQKGGFQVSPGLIIQIGVLAVGMASGWFTLQANVSSINGDLADHEVRLRSLEQTTITQSADLRATAQTLNDIKGQLQENNRLLRQLLSQGDPR